VAQAPRAGGGARGARRCGLLPCATASPPRPWPVCGARRMSTKKRIKPGKVEASADFSALVVHFTTEITHLDEEGNAGEVDKVPGSREVPVAKALKGLPAADIAVLAQEISDQCKYIPASKVKQVEIVLTKLHAAVNGKTPAEGDRRRASAGFGKTLGAGEDHWAPAASTNGSSASPGWKPSDLLPWATADNIDDYAEAMYEEKMEAKAAGAQKILRLCTDVQFLEPVSGHDTLMGVLSRELRENGKRSHELAVAITGIFACLAHFQQFHRCLTSNQCGEATMRVLEYESKRRTMLRKELKLHQGEMVARGSAATPEQRQKLDREEQQYRSVLDRQDRLLLLCVLVLRNLAEDVAIEKKLVAHKICHFLGPLLSRHCEDVLWVALGFLHKLSIFEQNKDQLVQSIEVVCRLADLAGHQNLEVAFLALRICYNLSFDHRGRTVFITQTSLLGKVLTACQQASSRKLAFKLLYMLSTETSQRSVIAKQGPACIAMALQLCSKCRDSPVDAESAALCINLSAEEACAGVLVKADGFAKLMLRGIQSVDALLLKVLRNVAGHASIRSRFFSVMNGGDASHAWLHKLVHLAVTATEHPSVLVEALGVFAALKCTSEQVPWPELCEAGLLELLQRLLTPGSADDDVVLECAIIAGTLASDAESLPLLATSRVPILLAELLAEKQADCDIMLQLMFAVRCMLLSDETGEIILLETEAVGHILQMLEDMLDEEHPEMPSALRAARALQARAEDLLDQVLAVEQRSACEARWGEEIKGYRFELHNLEWCRVIAGSDPASARPSPEPGGVSQCSEASNLVERCLGATSNKGFGATGFGATNGHKKNGHR